MARKKMSTVKRDGRETENAFVEYVGRRWNKVIERRRQKGTKDEGDITGWDNVCVEVKMASGKTININEWLRQLADEKVNSGSDYGFIAARPRGKPRADDWYAIIPLEDLMQMFFDLEILLSDDVIT